MSDPITTRLNRRRAELVYRGQLLEAEAKGAGWSEGASLAMHAAWDEAEFLGGLYELLLLVAIRDDMERRLGSLD